MKFDNCRIDVYNSWILIWLHRSYKLKKSLIMLLVLGLAVLSITGCEKEIVDSMMDVMDAPTKDDPEAYTVALVHAAIDLYKSGGIEAVETYHNDPANIDGQWYVFVTDENDHFIAHAQSPALVGTDLKDVPGLDGSTLGVDIASATETGLWIEYLWPNPDTNKLEQKRTWSIRHDGYLFASGYYEAWKPDPATLPVVSKDDPVAFTHDIVLKAIARYEFEGRDAAAAYYNNEASIDGQWYVFITDENDIFVAHAPMNELIGTDLKEVKWLEEDVERHDGSTLGASIAKATVTGTWIDYLWPNPSTEGNELKRTWAIRHDGYLFGSGYYEPVESTETDSN